MAETEEVVPLAQEVIDDLYLLFLISAVILVVGYGVLGLIDFLRIPVV